MLKRKSKWGKVQQFVFQRPQPTTSAWSRVDMSVLFPDLYKRKHALTADMMAGRLVPPTDTIANKRQIYVASQAVGLYSMHFLQATTEVALGFGNGKINVHNYKTTKRSYTAQPSPDSMPVTGIKDDLSSDYHRIVAATADGLVKTYKLDEEEGLVETSTVDLGDPIYTLDTSPSYHVCALDNRRIQVIDASRAEYVRDVGRVAEEFDEEEEFAHKQRVSAISFLPDNHYQCVSAGWDRAVFLWDIRLEPEKAAVRTFKGPKVCGDGLDVLGNKCITASLSIDNALQMWDLGSGKLIKSIKYKENDNHAEYLYSCKFVDSHRIFAGGSGSNDAKIINSETEVVEGVFYDAKAIHSVAYGSGVVAAGGVSCYVHVGDFDVNGGE